MKKWEYIISFDTEFSEFMIALDKRGASGWELVTVIERRQATLSASTAYTAYFKREIPA